MGFTMKKQWLIKTGIRWKGGAYLMGLDFTNDVTLLANARAELQSTTTTLER